MILNPTAIQNLHSREPAPNDVTLEGDLSFSLEADIPVISLLPPLAYK
jgi:hypothetical protein